MIEIATLTIIYLAYLAFCAKRLMNYLHALQQDDYDNSRFWRWTIKNKVFDKRATFLLLLLSIPAALSLIPPLATHFLTFLIFAIIIFIEKDARKDGKKNLILTPRARRILNMSLVICAAFGSIGFFISTPAIWILPIQLIPLILISGNKFLQPHEKAVQQKFAAEAKEKLEQMRPNIIGITGSYGKTSVKHILGHILGSTAPTLMTPGSVNTLMGITRIIREHLQPNHKYFIVEMGAYGPGSIKALCELTPPDTGIITSIGHAHYERFKTLDTVAHAKFELAESVLSRGGMVIIGEKTLRFKHTQQMRHKDARNFIVCGGPDTDGHLTKDDLAITLVDQNSKGLVIGVMWQGKEHALRAPIYGHHHAENIAMAFATAMSLGIEADDIKAALTRLPQIAHRLELKKQDDGSALLDDAYNSNPTGFRSALDLLKKLKEDYKRTILVTPGIVELGPAHDDTHEKLGAYAADCCDIAIIIQPDRIPTFIEGFQKTNPAKPLKTFNSFLEAQSWLTKNRKKGDLILLENDLPDIYEDIPKI
ncbi:MAG: UDP-N-acetylmuramoyl-tripeptide--D-alanyl-D-alanine ligase [Alphaproteobacteria bacterium]|nr:UDP-N-acetylmuramoyl-tripeptide--D-alanyl-D-alanine ligase [Alphaproteobacteria bacterium]